DAELVLGRAVRGHHLERDSIAFGGRSHALPGARGAWREQLLAAMDVASDRCDSQGFADRAQAARARTVARHAEAERGAPYACTARRIAGFRWTAVVAVDVHVAQPASFARICQPGACAARWPRRRASWLTASASRMHRDSWNFP